MHKEYALTDSPERRGAEHIRPGGALYDVISQVGAHVVNQQVGVEVDGFVAQGVALDARGGPHLRGVAGGAAHRLEGLQAALRAGAERDRLRRVEEAHEEGELHPVQQMEWIV